VHMSKHLRRASRQILQWPLDESTYDRIVPCGWCICRHVRYNVIQAPNVNSRHKKLAYLLVERFYTDDCRKKCDNRTSAPTVIDRNNAIYIYQLGSSYQLVKVSSAHPFDLNLCLVSVYSLSAGLCVCHHVRLSPVDHMPRPRHCHWQTRRRHQSPTTPSIHYGKISLSSSKPVLSRRYQLRRPRHVLDSTRPGWSIQEP